MGLLNRVRKIIRAFCIGCFFGIFITTSIVDDFSHLTSLFTIEKAYAATGIIRPNANSTTNQGASGTCGANGAYDCLNDIVTDPTTPSDTSSDVLVQSRNNVDFVQLQDTITDAATVTRVDIHVYHRELSSNMLLDISLFDNGESVQIGTTQNLPVVTTAPGGWSTAAFTSLSLTPTQLQNLRVRLRCTRPSGGGATSCNSYAMYANVTYTPVTNITVSTTGTQLNLDVGETNQYVGGTFVFAGNTDSRDVTSITISETGSVDAQNDLSNLRLYYENSTNCAAESYNGTENPYDTAKSFNGSSQATFAVASGIGVTPSSQLCMYAVVDVDDTASAGQALDLQITNPSTQVVGSGSAVVVPATPIALGGSSSLLEENLQQVHYHWRNDNGTNETDATSATDDTEDASYDAFPRNQAKRLRIEVANTGTGSSDANEYVLEYGSKVTECSALTEGDWTGIDEASDDWDMTPSGVVSDGNTSNVALFSNGAVTDVGSTFNGTGALRTSSGTSGPITLVAGGFTELEYSIEATNSASEGSTYCFRVTNAGTPLTYTTYPEATINADLTVSAFGSQEPFITIPNPNVYNGGGFSIVDSTAGVHNITSVTIHASGTVDLQNDISDVQLWYEFDTTGADNYDCSSEGYGIGGTETQYGSTDANGFDGSNTSTFTGSITASTTRSVCFYVVYTVDAEATDGELIEIRLNDPTVDLVVDSGSLSPATLTDISGVTTLVRENPTQIHYHWRNDDGDETSATSATGNNEDTIFGEAAANTPYRLRIAVSNEGGATTTAKQYSLEWAQRLSTCEEATGWVGLDDAVDEFAMITSGNISDGNTTNILNATNGAVTDENLDFVGTGALRDTTATSGSITLSPTEFTELEYAIEATDDTAEGATYCFRVTDQGTPLTSYTVYPEMSMKLGRDFVIHRGVTTISADTATISNGGAYTLQTDDASRAFIRIVNSQLTGAGTGGNTNENADDVTAYIVDPSNLVTGVTFARAAFPGGSTRVSWEIVEYIGDDGGENEIIVRQASTATYVSDSLTVTTGSVSGVVDDNDIVPFITGQWNPDAGRNDFNTVLSTSAWNAVGDTVTFTRNEHGGDAVVVSYAVVEFTGSNWEIRRVEHTYDGTSGYPEAVAISPSLSSGDISRAFVHAQKRTTGDTHNAFGHAVWLSSMAEIQFELDSGITSGSAPNHTSVAWIIDNVQTAGDVMRVSRSNWTIPSGASAPQTLNVNIGNTLKDITTASIFITTHSNGATRSWPESIVSARILSASTTQYELWIADTSDSVTYRTEVVEWPTASSKLEQNYYRLYEDNDESTPTTSWSGLGENEEMTANDDPIASGENVRIRMTLNVTSASLPAGVDAFQLEYGERVTTCTAIQPADWFELGDVGSTTALWRGHDATPDDGTTLSSTTISVSDVFGTYEEENDTALVPNNALVGEDIEFDWNVQHNSAKDKTSYCFRMTYADGSEIENYLQYPVVRTVGYGPEVDHWQWFDDEYNLTPTTTLAASNTVPTDIADNNSIKLRMIVTEKSGATGVNTKFKLQFSEYADFSTAVHDVVSVGQCAGDSLWCYADGVGVDNAIIDDDVFDIADCVGGVGNGCGTYNESSSTVGATFDHQALTSAEFEFTIKNDGARANAVYYFRLWDVVNDEAVTASTSYPSLVVEGAQLVFELSGVASGTTIDNEMLNVTSTTSTIPYGSVPFGTEYVAAYRLHVDTNATEGYQVLMYVDQQLTNSYGHQIQPITGDNASPTQWDDGCSDSFTSCFGYHVEDDLLANGSMRFALNDTYAALSTTPEEVMYSSIPSEDTHDIVYKIKISEEQPAGEYTAAISFISIPIF